MIDDDAPQRYEITVRGRLDISWTRWFGDMQVAHHRELDATVLTGTVSDQAALRGLLSRLFNLNLTLLSVRRLG